MLAMHAVAFLAVLLARSSSEYHGVSAPLVALAGGAAAVFFLAAWPLA